MQRNQWHKLKPQFPNKLLFIKIGDFYETYDEDAETVADKLDTALTSVLINNLRVFAVGIPYHSFERHVATLIHIGYEIEIKV